MDRSDVARALEEVGALLELKGEPARRARAWQGAARAIMGYGGDLDDAHRSGALAELGGLGPATLAVVEELLATGRSRLLDDLRTEVPPALVTMLEIPGLGVQTVRRLHTELGIDSLGELEDAARDGRLAALPRFGQRTAENVLRALRMLARPDAMLFHHAQREVRELAGALAELSDVERAVVAGDVRRRLELITDLDLVVELRGTVDAFYDRLARTPGVSGFAHRQERSVTLRFTSGTVAEVHHAGPADFGFALVCATGSDEHLRALRRRAGEIGVTWSEGGLSRGGEPVPLPDEAAVYAALTLPWIPPELREGQGEVDAATAGGLPDLVTRDDVLGFLHCHTNYSDGTSTVAEWAAAGAGAGFGYVGVTDHSESAPFAGGLAPEQVARQHAEIDTANAAGGRCRVLKGVEADILEDGSLDYPPDVRRSFEFIIASVHAGHGHDEATMTARVLTAMDDPMMTIFGHPTGRLLLSRDPFPMDLDRIFERAAERGVAIEINADPQRLDLDWRMVRRAVEAGVTISIGADAHSTAGMDNLDIGIGLARKGWLTADNLLNALPTDEFLRRAAGRRRAAT